MAIKFLDEEENKATGGIRFLDEPGEPQHDDSWMYKVASEQQINEWRGKGPIGFVEAFNRFDKWDIVPYLGSVKDGVESIAMYGKLQKAANGETLTTQEQTEVQEFLRDYTEIQARGYSLGGNFINATLGSIPFMVEAGVAIGTFGAGAGATAGTTGAKVAGKTALKGVTKQLLKTQVKMLPTVAKNYGDRLLNDGIAITDKGQAIAKEAEKNPAITAVKALADTNIELATEAFVGKLFHPVAGAVGVGTKKTMPKKLITELDKLGTTKGGKLASELLKARDKVGFNGFIEEHAEEIVGNVLKTALDLDPDEGYSFEQFLSAAVPSLDEFLITSGVIAVQGGMSIGTYRAIKALERKGAPKEDIDNFKTQMSEVEKEKIASDLESAEPKKVEETPPGVEQAEDITDEQTQYDYGLTEEGTGFVSETQTTNNENGTDAKARMSENIAKVAEIEQTKTDAALKGAVSVDVKKVDTARKNQIRSEIKTVDKQLSDLSKRWDRAFKEENDAEVQRIEKEMDKLVEERDALELERDLVGKTVTSEKGEKIQMTRQQANDIQSVAKAKRVLQAINQGFKSGVKMTKASLKIAQKEYKNLIRLLPQSERGRVAFDFQKFNSVEDATKNIDEFQNKINRILEKAELRAYNKVIARQLKIAKPTKLSEKSASKSARGFKTSEIGAEAGNVVADIQAVLGKIRSWVKDDSEINDEALTEAMNDAITKEDKVTVEIADAIIGFKNGNLEKTKKLYEMLGALLEGRKTTAMLKTEAEKEVFDKLRADAKTSIEGDKPADFDKVTGKKDIVKRFLRAFGHTHDGWHGILNILAMHDKTNTLQKSAEVFYETRNEHEGRRKAGDRFMKVLKNKVPEFNNEREYSKKMFEDTKEQDFGEYIDNNGKPRRFIATKSQLRKLWMEFQAAKENEILRLSFEHGNKFTFKDSENAAPGMTTEEILENNMTDLDVRIAEAQLEFYDEYYKRANEFYRAKHGIDMPREKLYSPIKRKIDDDTRGAWSNEYQFRASALPGAMKARTSSIAPLELRSDINVLSGHIAEIEHGIAWDTKVKKLRYIFGNAEIRDVIKQKYGDSILKVIDKFINDFAMGGQKLAEAHTAIADTFRKNFTKAALGFKPALIVKQFVSMFTSIDEVGSANWLKSFASFMSNPQKAINELKESEMLKARGISIDRDLAEISKLRTGSLVTPNPKFTELLFLTTRMGDKGGVYVSGWAVYQKVLAETGSKEKAIEAFERAFDSSQQSANLYQLSDWQRGNSIARLFTMFTSSQNMYYRKEVHAIRNLIAGKATKREVARTIFVYHFLLPMAFQYVADFGRWDEGNQLRAGILGSLNGVFWLGDLADIIVSSGLYLAGKLDSNEIFNSEIPVFDTVNSIVDAVKKIDPEDLEVEDVIKSVELFIRDAVGPAVGLPIKTVLDELKGLYELASPDTDDKVGAGGKAMGWSPYVIEKRREGDSGNKMAWE